MPPACPRSRTPTIAAALLAAGGVGVLAYSVYRRSGLTPGPSTVHVPSSSAPTYTVRGRVEQLPDASVKGSMFQVHHEAIPTWIGRDGTVVGMKEMVMPFPPAEGVSLAGLAVGDAVEFEVQVDWSRLPPQRTIAVRKLPPETVLRIGPAGR